MLTNITDHFVHGLCEIRCIFILTRIHQSLYGDGAGAG